MLNRVTLIGNLGRKPEFKVLDSGIAVAKFSVATNEYYKEKDGTFTEKTEWHDITVWRDAAEKLNSKQLDKGAMVFVEGKLTHRKYTDKDGVDRYATDIVANLVRVLDRKQPKTENGVSAVETEGDFSTEAELAVVESENLPF